jgi:hypothetical protein
MSLGKNPQLPSDFEDIEVEVRYTDEDRMIKVIKEYGERFKFVLSEYDGFKTITLGPTDVDHVRLFDDGETLIGGGRTFISIEDDEVHCSADWGSGTCVEEKGYDRPKDDNEAEVVLNQTKTIIQNWVRSALS